MKKMIMMIGMLFSMSGYAGITLQADVELTYNSGTNQYEEQIVPIQFEYTDKNLVKVMLISSNGSQLPGAIASCIKEYTVADSVCVENVTVAAGGVSPVETIVVYAFFADRTRERAILRVEKAEKVVTNVAESALDLIDGGSSGDLDGASIDFGSVDFSDGLALKNIYIKNNGSSKEPLPSNLLTSSPFLIVSGGSCASKVELNPGQVCSFKVFLNTDYARDQNLTGVQSGSVDYSFAGNSGSIPVSVDFSDNNNIGGGGSGPNPPVALPENEEQFHLLRYHSYELQMHIKTFTFVGKNNVITKGAVSSANNDSMGLIDSHETANYTITGSRTTPVSAKDFNDAIFAHQSSNNSLRGVDVVNWDYNSSLVDHELIMQGDIVNGYTGFSINYYGGGYSYYPVFDSMVTYGDSSILNSLFDFKEYIGVCLRLGGVATVSEDISYSQFSSSPNMDSGMNSISCNLNPNNLSALSGWNLDIDEVSCPDLMGVNPSYSTIQEALGHCQMSIDSPVAADGVSSFMSAATPDYPASAETQVSEGVHPVIASDINVIRYYDISGLDMVSAEFLLVNKNEATISMNGSPYLNNSDSMGFISSSHTASYDVTQATSNHVFHHDILEKIRDTFSSVNSNLSINDSYYSLEDYDPNNKSFLGSPYTSPEVTFAVTTPYFQGYYSGFDVYFDSYGAILPTESLMETLLEKSDTEISSAMNSGSSSFYLEDPLGWAKVCVDLGGIFKSMESLDYEKLGYMASSGYSPMQGSYSYSCSFENDESSVQAGYSFSLDEYMCPDLMGVTPVYASMHEALDYCGDYGSSPIPSPVFKTNDGSSFMTNPFPF